MAQTTYTVSGIIKDSTGQAVTTTNILLIAGKDTLHTTSSETGKFTFTNVRQPIFILRADRLGYETWYKQFTFPETMTQIDLPLITLTIKTNILKEVVVKGKRTPIVIKGDTIEYQVDQYQLRENAVVEDLLKRLPGLIVDGDGNITAMGKSIARVRINGKDFLVDDIKSLTRLLPVDLISKIQLIDDYGDMAQATGRKTGESDKVMNIQTKADLNKVYQAQAVAGAGNEGRYNAGVLANYFSEQQQLSLNGNSNNISAQTGNMTTTKGNINYRGIFSKKLSINTGLSGGHISNSVRSSSNVETVTGDGTLYSSNNNSNNSSSETYSFITGGSYRSGEADIINFNMNFNKNSLANNNATSSIQSGFQRKDQATASNITSSSPKLTGSLFATHRFKKPGRIISLNLSANHTKNDNDQDSRDELRYYNADNSIAKDSLLHQLLQKVNNTLTTNAQVSWVEPLDSTTSLELKYVLNHGYNDNKQATQWINADGNKDFIDSLSNQYNYTTTQQQIDLNYRRNKGRLDYTIGARLLPSNLRSNALAGKRMAVRSAPIVPSVRVQYTLPPTAFFSIMYSGNVTFPTYQQLQPAPDLTNPQFPVIGNPDLQSSLSHMLFFVYHNVNINPLFISLSANYTQDKVVTNVILVKDSFNTVKQETHFLNTNGDYYCRLDYSWSLQIDDGKYNIFLDGNSYYANNVLYMDDVRKTAKNLAITQSVKANRLRKQLELTGGVSYTYNRNAYILSENNKTTNFSTWTFHLDGKIYFMKTFSLIADASKQLNSGYSGAINVNPLMINGTLEKTFFKRKLTLRLQGYNLLDETSRLSQSISGNSITENRSNLIGRYFMLSLQCDLKMFKGK